MKTRIIVLIGLVALVTLSFTFSSKAPSIDAGKSATSPKTLKHEIGFIADEVVK